MLKREVLEGIDFDAGSWKILVEILVKGHYARVAELPYHFQSRELGSSKLSISAQIDYIRHLKTLFFCRQGRSRRSFPPASVDRIAP